MPLDPAIGQRIDELVADLRVKGDEFGQADDANDQAQAAAQAAVANASNTARAKTAAHDNLTTSIDALVEYVLSLKQLD